MSRGLLTGLMALLIFAASACGDDIEAGGGDGGEQVDADPLDIPAAPDDGSLDTLHRTIIGQRCSGEPGLCHNGQFEPNLSTPALTYLYMVNRPSIENGDVLRVAPGDADASFLIDKLRDRNGVGSQMPLGADPLTEEEIQAIEAWIDGGALRSPDAEAAPVLNNPPVDPEIAVFDSLGTRLDAAGPFAVSVGQQLTFRHSVEDFETEDEDVDFAFVALSTAVGDLVLDPGNVDDPNLGSTAFDPSGPQGVSDQLNYRFEFTVPAQVDVIDPDTGELVPDVPTTGMVITVAAAYIDTFSVGQGFAALSFEQALITVE